MGVRHSRLAAAMAAAWEAELVSAHRLTACAEVSDDERVKSRLLVLGAFCRAHASRLMARLSSMGRGPMPVPPEESLAEMAGDLRLTLRREAASARFAASRYEEMAEWARERADLSTAWVCELNRGEEEDRSSELVALLEQIPSPLEAAASSRDGAELHPV